MERKIQLDKKETIREETTIIEGNKVITTTTTTRIDSDSYPDSVTPKETISKRVVIKERLSLYKKILNMVFINMFPENKTIIETDTISKIIETTEVNENGL